jgi:ArsR family transcriptional regulator
LTDRSRINDALYQRSCFPSFPHPEKPWTAVPSPARIRSTIGSIVDQPDELRELRVFHKALADVNRLRIVQRLAHGRASVTELIEHVGLSQPLVSWHLGRLRAAGLVETKRKGREVQCSLRSDAFEAMAARQRDVLGIGAGSLATPLADPGA